MAFERKWPVVAPKAFTADGGQFGLITVADTAGFKVKQTAYLKSNTKPNLPVQVKRVLSTTQLVVGTINSAQIGQWPPLNISAYTVVDSASIGAEMQDSAVLKPDDIEVLTYENEPTKARRVVFVDQYGNFYDDTNPLPIDFTGTITLGNVGIIGPHPDDNQLVVNPDGSINVVIESIPSSTAIVVSTYNEVMAVASGLTTQIVSYTIPVGKTAVLQRATVSGENIARYDLLINGVIQDTVRTMFGSDLSETFDFTSGNDSGLLLASGDVVKIQVLHNRPSIANFNGRIQVLVIT